MRAEHPPGGNPAEFLQFIERKSQMDNMAGFEPVEIPDFLFDFQKFLLDFSIRQGRSATFADCGLGKTPMQLAWARNVVRHTNKRALVVTTLGVSGQTVREAEKFDFDAKRSREGKPAAEITVTNYEKLHLFDPNDYAGVVLDESSAIKHFEGKRQQLVTQFLAKMPYRLACTATAAPNDFIELGTTSEALGELGRMDMLSRFFRNDEKSNHPQFWGARWWFKAHAEDMFWRWVCSWARACRKPSDYGFDDGEFQLPPLITNETVVTNERPFTGSLFVMPAVTLREQREERRLTLQTRCEKVAELLSHDRPGLAWCHMNDEGDLLEKLIPGARQVKGSQSDEEKEELFLAFASGELSKLVTKTSIAGFGFNWQHCDHMTCFPSHSFEQWYQGVRRCWRFGQKNPVTVDMVTTEGEKNVLANLQGKAANADKMFERLVALMGESLEIERKVVRDQKQDLPSWL